MNRGLRVLSVGLCFFLVDSRFYLYEVMCNFIDYSIDTLYLLFASLLSSQQVHVWIVVCIL